MKNLINRDCERIKNKFDEKECAHGKKKMHYDRVLLVKATGKFSSKQSDTSMKISNARYNRRRANNLAMKEMLEEEARLFEEAILIEQGIMEEEDLLLS